ncbi:MAG TPA: DUF1269 domain-containing protein [Devosiaceae bacterium]|nr:DUF1269 domain-containing protein [Devosiaceae bacterium]
MADLVVIVYPDEQKAEEMRQKLLHLQEEYLIELADAVIAVKDERGHIKLNQLIRPTVPGALGGSLWGLLIGTLFLFPLGPLAPIGGAAIGAASGALAGALTDVGIDDQFVRDLGNTLQPGNAALFLLIRKLTVDKVLKAVEGTGGTVLQTSFDEGREAMLREALQRHHAEVEPNAAA